MPKFAPKPALRAYREKHGLTVDEAGEKVGIAGTTWRSYENGHREVAGDTALHFERVLGIKRAAIRPDLFVARAA